MIAELSTNYAVLEQQTKRDFSDVKMILDQKEKVCSGSVLHLEFRNSVCFVFY